MDYGDRMCYGGCDTSMVMVCGWLNMVMVSGIKVAWYMVMVVVHVMVKVRVIVMVIIYAIVMRWGMVIGWIMVVKYGCGYSKYGGWSTMVMYHL